MQWTGVRTMSFAWPLCTSTNACVKQNHCQRNGDLPEIESPVFPARPTLTERPSICPGSEHHWLCMLDNAHNALELAA